MKGQLYFNKTSVASKCSSIATTTMLAAEAIYNRMTTFNTWEDINSPQRNVGSLSTVLLATFYHFSHNVSLLINLGTL